MAGLCFPAIVSFASSEEHGSSGLPALPYRPSSLERVELLAAARAAIFPLNALKSTYAIFFPPSRHFFLSRRLGVRPTTAAAGSARAEPGSSTEPRRRSRRELQSRYQGRYKPSQR